MAKIKLAADFKDFLKLCLIHEVRFMVIGGYAVIHYSRPRYTGDLDIWVDVSADNIQALVHVLLDFGFPPSEATADIFLHNAIIRMGFEPMRLELFTHIPGVTFADCFPRRSLVNLGRLKIPFIGLEDLKTNKKAVNRPKDLQDLEELP